jgi:hypothetical protein
MPFISSIGGSKGFGKGSIKEPRDSFFSNTVLLLNGDVSTGALSNIITDATVNNTNVTPFGDSRESPFSPYNTSWGIELTDATNTQVNFTTGVGSTFVFTGDFTIEAWVNIPSGGDRSIYVSSDNGTNYLALNYSFSASQFNIYLNGGGPAFTPSYSMTPGWHHVALVRSGSSSGNVKVYVDGIGLATTATNTNTLGFTNPGFNRIGGGAPSTPQFISNLRICKSALYTTNFSPASSNFTTTSQGATNCILLTAQDNRFLDKASAFVASLTGTPRITAASPFADADAVTGSIYLNGSANFLSADNQIAFSNGDFTLEGWTYLITSGDHPLFESRSANNVADGFTITALDNTTLRIWDTTARVTYTSTTGSVLNQWIHICVERISGITTFYVNGVSAGTTTAFGNLTSTVFRIGGGSYYGAFAGYVSNFRLVTNSFIYNGNFTPPTSPLTVVSNTRFLSLQNRSASNNFGFRDDSGFKRLVSKVGNVSQGTFSPYTKVMGEWSAYFDGNGDFLTVPADTAFNLGTGDFTIEFWAWLDPYVAYSGSSYWAQIIGIGVGNSDSNSVTNTVGIWQGDGTGSSTVAGEYTVIISGTSANEQRLHSGITSYGKWTHVSLTRENGTFRLFQDGSLRDSATVTADISRNDFQVIGKSINSNIKGYISNLRVVKGTALYTSTFTPPSSSLTAISGTSLLTCRNTRHTDSSTANAGQPFTVTVNGNPSVEPFSPVVSSSVVYNPTTDGGSAFVDSSGGDYLTLPASTTLSLASTQWTVECWVYPVSYINAQGLWGASNGGGAQQKIALQVNSTNYTLYVQGSPTISATLPPLKQWTHVLVSRATNGTGYIYYNGILQTSGSVGTQAITSPFQWFTNGEGATTGMAGYISSGRVSDIARYSGSNFVVPSGPLTSDGNTLLLNNFTNTGIIDLTGDNVIETFGNAHVETRLKKYGSASIEVDGVGDYLLTQPTVNLEFGPGNFTIEFWWYPTSTTRQALYHGSFGTDWSVGIDYSSVSTNQKIGIWASSNGTSWNLVNADGGGNGIGTTTVLQNSWNHIAYVRSGTTWMLFVNGNRDLNLTNISGSIIDRSASRKAIGTWYSTSVMSQATGHLDDFRITKGLARYTNNFTPPSRALPKRS